MTYKKNILLFSGVVMAVLFFVTSSALAASNTGGDGICTQEEYDGAKKAYDEMEKANTAYENIKDNNTVIIDNLLNNIIPGIEEALTPKKKSLEIEQGKLSAIELHLQEVEAQLKALGTQLKNVQDKIRKLEAIPERDRTEEQKNRLRSLREHELQLQTTGLELTKEQEAKTRERARQKDKIRNFEKDIQKLQEELDKNKSEREKLEGEIRAAEKLYEFKLKNAAKALGLPKNATYFQINQAKQAADNWKTGDCDGDGVLNGPTARPGGGGTIPGDYYPRDPDRSRVGETGGLVPCGASSDSAGACTLCHFIVGFHNIITTLTKWIVSIAIAIITISGIVYIMSTGNESMISLAKAGIKNALLGAGVMLLAWVLISFILNAMSLKEKDEATFIDGGGLQRKEGSWSFTCSTTPRELPPAPAFGRGSGASGEW